VPVLALALVALALLGGCAPRPGSAPAPAAGAWPGAGHPLAGRIWDVGAARFLDAPALAGRLVTARFVLLGEKHDNPEHHRRQAELLRALVAAGRRPAVVFEMLAVDQEPQLAAHLARAPRDAAGLGAAVGWEQRGWPPWALYAPIAEVALDAGLALVAGDLPRALQVAVRREGLGALEAGLRARTGLDRPLDPATRAAMAAALREAHCGYAPEGALDRMVDVQRARDAHLAARLAAAPGDGAVLIAGAGHVRRDWGVPVYLARLAPAADVASVALVEVDDRRLEPTGYADRWGGTLPFDALWFTPRVDDLDPCEKFRGALERWRR